MRKSKLRVQKRNCIEVYGKNQNENIHFLIDQIPKVNYDNIYFLSNNKASYEDMLIYCEFLYNEGLKHSSSLKDLEFTETDSLVSVIGVLENLVLEQICRINAFCDWTVYDFNMRYLKDNLSENIKIGLTKCINQIYQTDSGALFDYPDVEYIIGDLEMDDSDEFGCSMEQKIHFKKVIKEYQDLYDKYIIQNFDPKIQCPDTEKDFYDIIIKILDFQESDVMWRNIFYTPYSQSFENIFIATIEDDNDELITPLFFDSTQIRCQLLGESDVSFIAQYYNVVDGKIKETVSPEQIKNIQQYEKDIDKLCSILKR